jgi:hypothetical protein
MGFIKKVIERFMESRRGLSLSIGNIVAMAIGLLLVGLLFPLALDSIESYTPTDATLLVVWPLLGVFAVLAVAITYIKSATD